MNDNFQRATAPKLEEIIGHQFKVLDDGFVRVIDYMGSDDSVVQAARVSYGKGTKKTSEDRGLIRYLLRNRHTTPFEMCEVKLHVRVPMDCWRQWIRHRTASVNEYSTRYSLAIDSVQRTDKSLWRKQAISNKQGSAGFIDESIGLELTNEETNLHEHIRSTYEKRIEKGVAREQARKDLSLSTYTEAYWKIDLHNLLHFLALRMDIHAQEEIRSYANVIGNEVVKRWCPLVWEAFTDYKLNSVGLSALEIKIVSLLVNNNDKEAVTLLESEGLIELSSNGIKKGREAVEIEEKLIRLGIPINFDRLAQKS